MTKSMDIMHIITFILISIGLHYSCANTTIEDCTASPFNAAPYSVASVGSPPALADLLGTWYVYSSSRSSWVPSLRCGACLVFSKSGATKMQCILLVNKYVNSQLKKYFKYITGTLTKTGSLFKLSPAQGTQDATFVVTTWADKNSPMAVTLCQLMDLGFMKFRYTYVIQLARKGAVTVASSVSEVEHKATCLDVVFEPSKADGQEDIPACCTSTIRPNSNLPVTDCTQEGWTKITSASTNRWYKVMPLKKSWSDAKTICEDLGYKLAKIEDATFLAGVKALLTDAECKDAWIGLSQSTVAAEASKYTWIADSTTFTVTASTGAPTNLWSKTPPADDKSNYDSDGTTITADANYCFSVDANAATFGWKEGLCTDELPFICHRTSCPSLTL